MSTAVGQPPPSTRFTNENRSHAFLIFVMIMTSVATVMVACRFLSRTMAEPSSRHPRFWWDDWFALSSLIILWILAATGVQVVHLGFGRHILTISSENLVIIDKYFFAVYFLYDLGLVSAKASILFFYSRVFLTRTNYKYKYAVYVIHAMNISWLVGMSLANFLLCKPFSKTFNSAILGKCGSIRDLWLGSAVPSAVIDLLILLVPVPLIWKLSLNNTRKFGLIAVFVFGYGALIASIGRVVACIRFGDRLVRDLTYEAIPIMYWVAAETPTVLISACLPAMVDLSRRASTSVTSLKALVLTRCRSTKSPSPHGASSFAFSDTNMIEARSENRRNEFNSKFDQESGFSTYSVSITANKPTDRRKFHNQASRQDADESSANRRPLLADEIRMQRDFSVAEIEQL